MGIIEKIEHGRIFSVFILKGFLSINSFGISIF